jgi:hypothetical protein
MVDLTLALASCAGVATVAGAISAVMPPALRPWWHARRDFVAPVLAPGALLEAAPALQVVETVDRRTHQLPFVGQDRRRSARGAAARDQRRHGNGE